MNALEFVEFCRKCSRRARCHAIGCILDERKEAKPKKIDVVEEMDRQEHQDFLDEYYPREGAKPQLLLNMVYAYKNQYQQK